MTATEVAPSQAIWSVIQVFDPERSAVRNKKVENVEPKAGKIRCMTHLAIAGGARGIIFIGYLSYIMIFEYMHQSNGQRFALLVKSLMN